MDYLLLFVIITIGYALLFLGLQIIPGMLCLKHPWSSVHVMEHSLMSTAQHQPKYMDMLVSLSKWTFTLIPGPVSVRFYQVKNLISWLLNFRRWRERQFAWSLVLTAITKTSCPHREVHASGSDIVLPRSVCHVFWWHHKTTSTNTLLVCPHAQVVSSSIGKLLTCACRQCLVMWKEV